MNEEKDILTGSLSETRPRGFRSKMAAVDESFSADLETLEEELTEEALEELSNNKGDDE